VRRHPPVEGADDAPASAAAMAGPGPRSAAEDDDDREMRRLCEQTKVLRSARAAKE
jgi:hypothetical protein